MIHRLVALSLVLFASLAVADDGPPPYTPPDFMSALPELPADAGGDAWHLGLTEALQIAVKQNLRVVLERDSIASSDLSIITVGGQFEPTLSSSYSHNAGTTPPLTLQAGSADQLYTSSVDGWMFDLRQRFETGTSVDVNFTTARTSSQFGTAVEPLNYSNSATLSISQPLLKGFSLDRTIPRIDILRAKIASDKERHQLAVTMTDVIANTEVAYWSLVQAIHSYDLQLSSEKLAENQLQLTHRQIDAGVLAPSDLLSAESTVAQRQLSVVQAEQSIEAAADQLRATLNLPRDQWARPILPTDPPQFAAEQSSPDDALHVALRSRPEIAQADLDLAAEDLAVRKVDNDKLPEIDVGLTGSLLGQDATFHGALHQVGTTDANTWQVVLSLTWTPLQRATTAAAKIERLHQHTLGTQREALVQQIWSDVRDAVRTQRGAARSVAAAAHARELAEKTLEVEQRRFLNNQSQNFLVAQRQQELAGAQLSELSAVLDHQKAAVALLKAEGRLLDARNIELK